MSARLWLALALLGLAVLFAAWFWRGGDHATLAVLVAPPLLLALMLRPWPRAAAFWSGVLALLWFSHGVMTAWSQPATRLFALAEVGLALVIIFAGNFAGLRARFGKSRVDTSGAGE